MKNIFKLVFLSSLLATAFWTCKKDDIKDYFKGGTDPVLTASFAESTLVTGDAAKLAVTFSWTNPEFQFTTGVSSQDVVYILQVDTAGSNFSNPAIQEVSIPKDLGTSFTVKDLNTILTKLDLQENVVHQLEFRIKATLAGSVVVLYSNVIGASITPYLDVAVPIPPTGALYMTGDGTASGWTNAPPSTQQCVKVSNTEYYIVATLAPGFYYKFLSTLNQWQPQYGGSSDTGGDIGYNFALPGQTDPPAMPTPAVAGSYKITLNFKTGKYTVVKQ